MIETIQFYMSYPFVRYALIVGVLIALCSSLFGVSLVLKRFSFIGDGLSHVAFGAMAVASVFQSLYPLPHPSIVCAIRDYRDTPTCLMDTSRSKAGHHTAPWSVFFVLKITETLHPPSNRRLAPTFNRQHGKALFLWLVQGNNWGFVCRKKQEKTTKCCIVIAIYLILTRESGPI